jgi:thiol-disulfide isomerase/thioredoxin
VRDDVKTPLQGLKDLPVLDRMKSPWSAHERDQSFLNKDGKSFMTISGLSGLNDPADGRCLAKLDFNHDGLTDLVASNQDYPTFRLYENFSSDGAENAFLAIGLVGGSRSARPSEWSNRDGIGAVIRVETDSGLSLRHEKRVGEGYSSQNSPTLLLGLGQSDLVKSLSITWPSGRVSNLTNVPVNKLVKVYEDVAHSGSGDGLEVGTYSKISTPNPKPFSDQTAPPLIENLTVGPKYSLLVTTATWCAPCKVALPTVGFLREQFGDDELGILGIPMDPEESIDTLKEYAKTHRPAYQLLLENREKNGHALSALLDEILGKVVLPAAILVNSKGQVLGVWPRLPSYSELKVIMAIGEPQAEILRELYLPPPPDIPETSMEPFVKDKKKE